MYAAVMLGFQNNNQFFAEREVVECLLLFNFIKVIVANLH